MADRETVITHLQIIHTWAEFARERDLQFFTAKHLEDIAQWTDDAHELLKEQDQIIKSHKADLQETLKVVSEQSNIVRCNECKWGHIKGNGKYTCSFLNGWHSGEWFCADGVWKTNT